MEQVCKWCKSEISKLNSGRWGDSTEIPEWCEVNPSGSYLHEPQPAGAHCIQCGEQFENVKASENHDWHKCIDYLNTKLAALQQSHDALYEALKDVVNYFWDPDCNPPVLKEGEVQELVESALANAEKLRAAK